MSESASRRSRGPLRREVARAVRDAGTPPAYAALVLELSSVMDRLTGELHASSKAGGAVTQGIVTTGRLLLDALDAAGLKPAEEAPDELTDLMEELASLMGPASMVPRS